MQKWFWFWSKATFWVEFQHHHWLKGLQRPWEAQTRCCTEKRVCRPSLATSSPTNGCVLHFGYNQMGPVMIYYWYQIKTHLIISKSCLQENISFPFWRCQPTFSYPSLGEGWNYKWNITGIHGGLSSTPFHGYLFGVTQKLSCEPLFLLEGAVSPCACASCSSLDWLSS